jgi:hypothetical protein
MCLLFIVPPIVINAIDQRVKNVEKLSKHKPSIVRTIHNDSSYKEYKRGETGFTTGRFMHKQFSNVEHCTYIEVSFGVDRQFFVDATDLKWVKYCDAKPYDNTIVSDGIITYGYKLYTIDDIRKTNEQMINNNNEK